MRRTGNCASAPENIDKVEEIGPPGFEYEVKIAAGKMIEVPSAARQE
jgi:hypothetical protein